MAHSNSKKVIYAALVGNTLISITKFGAAAIEQWLETWAAQLGA